MTYSHRLKSGKCFHENVFASRNLYISPLVQHIHYVEPSECQNQVEKNSCY